MKLSDYNIDQEWTLFLDRDGVINKRLHEDYVKTWADFEFLPGVLDALTTFSKVFGKVFIVSNQQGIGKGLMTKAQLEDIHQQMLKEINAAGGRIDKIYYCPHKAEDNSKYRKPHVGMALHARKDFPEVNFKSSLMVGDTITDMQFGKNVRMKTAFISDDLISVRNNFLLIDFHYNDLFSLASEIQQFIK